MLLHFYASVVWFIPPHTHTHTQPLMLHCRRSNGVIVSVIQAEELWMEIGENDLWNWPLWVEVVVEVMGLTVDNSDS